MESIKKIYRIGRGPSSSHTMAPKRAAEKFLAKNLHAHRFRVTLFESLAATGKGHLSDLVIKETFTPAPVEIVWKPEQRLPEHPNGMLFEAFDESGNTFDSWKVYSVGGGALREEGAQISSRPVYTLNKPSTGKLVGAGLPSSMHKAKNHRENSPMGEIKRTVF